MKTILVPTDFSPVAKNAVHYAIELAKQASIQKIILYHVYEIPVTGDPISPMLQMIDVDELKKSCEANMQHFSTIQLRDYDMDGVELETICELGALTSNIEAFCEKIKIEFIVMGITGVGMLEETLMGSNSVSVAKQLTVPVIIVPADARFVKLERVMLACDFKKMIETTPVGPIRELINISGARLFVLHVDHINEKFSTEKREEMKILDELLLGLQPVYLFVDNDDFTEAINSAAEKNEIDLIITIPKKHSFFEGLFKRSHLRMMACHNHTPLMVVHE